MTTWSTTISGLIPNAVIDQIKENLLKEQVWFAPSGTPIKYKVSRWKLLKIKVRDLRESVGFWIAGYTPPDDYY